VIAASASVVEWTQIEFLRDWLKQEMVVKELRTKLSTSEERSFFVQDEAKSYNVFDRNYEHYEIAGMCRKALGGSSEVYPYMMTEKVLDPSTKMAIIAKASRYWINLSDRERYNISGSSNIPASAKCLYILPKKGLSIKEMTRLAIAYVVQGKGMLEDSSVYFGLEFGELGVVPKGAYVDETH